MEKLRAVEPEYIGGSRVVNIRDYNAETSKNTLTGEITGTGLPKSNVIYFKAENGCVVVARPSGTEPKIKFYCGVKGTSFEDADAKMTKLKNELTALVK